MPGHPSSNGLSAAGACRGGEGGGPIRGAVSLVFPRTHSRGGARVLLAWAAQALQDVVPLRLWSLDRPDPASWNELHGTAVRPDALTCLSFEDHHPRLARALTRLRMATLDQYVIMTWVRRHLPDGDLPFSMSNEMDFGRPGIQYVNAPMLMHGRPDLARIIGQPGTPAKEVMGWTCKLLSGARRRRIRQNRTLGNSPWIAELARTYYGPALDADYLFPACTMAGVPSHAEWKSRRPGVLVIGRLTPAKRVEDAVEAVEICRRAGAPLGLHIITVGGASAYRDALRERTRGLDWVEWHEELSRGRLLALMTENRYGIHANRHEHFGMATAEMFGSGCLVVGHDSGGTRDILPRPEQRFRTGAEAGAALLRIHRDEALQRELLRVAAEHTAAFRPENFIAAIRSEVERMRLADAGRRSP